MGPFDMVSEDQVSEKTFKVFSHNILSKLMFCLVEFFTSQSTAMTVGYVMSAHLTTLFFLDKLE